MTDTLGRILEKKRHSLGKSLLEAEAVTKIRAKSLDALEQGEYGSLPDPAYVKGYIVSYAKFLGLDPAPLVEAYERDIGGAPDKSVRLPEQVVSPRSQTHAIPVQTALAVVAVIAVLVASVWGIGRLISGPQEPPPIPPIPETTTTAGQEGTPTAGPGEPDSDTQTPPVEESVDPGDSAASPDGPFTVRVVIADDGASWLRVTIDDLVAYEGTMAGGQSDEWTAEETAVLRIGRAPAVTVFQDGEPVEIPPGDPPVLELPIEQ